MKIRDLFPRAIALALTFSLQPAGLILAAPAGTTFTYQGKLTDGTSAANGSYDLKFNLYDALSSGNQVGGSLTNTATGVTNGSFAVALDFGSIFDGNARWLEIGVRTNGGGPFVTLAPRQELTPSPYAVFAPNAGSANSVAAANIAGALSLSQLPGAVVTNHATGLTLAGTFTGTGSALTGVNSDQLDGQHGAFYQNAANLSAGTLLDARLSANVALLATNQVFSGSNRFAGVVSLTNAANTFVGTFSGNGAGLTNLSGASITSGSISTAQLAAGSVTSAQLAAGAVGTAQIADGSVTLADLAPNSVDSSKVVDGSLTSADLASDGASLAKVSGGAMAVASGKIGIGSGAADRPLAVTGTGTVGEWLSLKDTNGITKWHLNNNLGGVDFVESGVADARLFLEPGGNIGIGTANPGFKVSFANVLGDKISLYGNSGNHYGFGVQSSRLQIHTDGSGSDVVFGYGESTNLTETMRIKGNGNVGVGTSTPATKLDVAGMASANSLNIRGAGLLAAPLDVVTRGWTIDQQQTVYNGYWWNTLWQSFTAGTNGTLAGVAVIFGADDGVSDWVSTFSIYEGEGTAGNLLSSQKVSGVGGARVRMFPLDAPVALTNGSKYTIYLSPNISCRWYAYNSDVYTNGMSSHGTGYDHWFRTYLDDGTVKTALEVQADSGNVGIGTTDPGFPLTFPNVLGDKISLWGNSGAHYGFGIQSSLLQIYSGGSGADIAFGCGESTNFTERVRFTGDGYVGIGTNNPTHPLHLGGGAYCTGTQWQNASDRNVKEQFTPIEPAEVLAKVAALPVTQWKYKSEPEGVKHLGPVAQDFHAAFGLGDSDKAIGTVDESGVALAAIQGLNQKLTAEVSRINAENRELKRTVQTLRETLEQLMNQRRDFSPF